ncbi:MAG: endonuclease [Myxococcales bacterium]|nr:endonuclease [Myxococcales bacterium]
MPSNGSVELNNENCEVGIIESHGEWRDIDRKLRVIARKRSALDAVEASLLREADRVEIWRELGCVSLLDYMERVLGYGPKAAQDRVRVSDALEELPALTQALARDELKFTAIRELTRVAIPRTEHAWRDEAIGKSLRQIEAMVAGRKKGDLPTDPANPDLRLRTIRLEVTPATYALWMQAQQLLEQEHGMRLDDDQIAAGMARGVVEGGAANEAPTRAKFQISITQCEKCRQGWQLAAGKEIAIQRSAMERAECDAQFIGHVDADNPPRSVQLVPPRVRQQVWVRDQGRCRVPGCRSSRHLEVHHIVFRSEGGDNSPRNLLVLCSSHHTALHEGKLKIIGDAADELEFRWAIDPHHGPDRFEAHVGSNRTQPSNEDARAIAVAAMEKYVKQALVDLRFKQPEAHAAVDDAIRNLRPGFELGDLIRESLKRCPPNVEAGQLSAIPEVTIR